MNRNESMKNQSLMVFGVLFAVIISVSAVIAYVYFQPPSNSISQKEINKEKARQESEVIKNKSAGVVTADVSLSDLIEADKPAKQHDTKVSAREDKVNDSLYAYVPDNSDSGNVLSRPERAVSHLKNPMSWPSRPVQPSDQPRVKKSGSGVSKSIYKQTYPDSFKDIIPDNSSGSGKSVHNDPDDESSLTDKGNANSDDTAGQKDNYSVSVSRSVNVGKVMLTVTVKNNPPNGLIINENIPAGWRMTSASPAPLNCRSFPCSGSMKWLFITQNVGNNITYTVEKINSSAASSISGNYFFKDPAAGRKTVMTKGASGV